MYSEKTLNDLLQLIYQAAADSERWPVFLERYQATLAARNLALVYEAPDLKRSLMFATGADEADIQKYHQSGYPLYSSWRTGAWQ